MGFTVLGCLYKVCFVKINNNEPILYKLTQTFTSDKIISLLRAVDMAIEEPNVKEGGQSRTTKLKTWIDYIMLLQFNT